ncbi:YibE/F family protein [Lachnoclostridium sp. An169]|uniref:YibE/F family protein n=1 Tax=Lachnoclostridium sp. An169 TaxID=1965569 RepID=UPI000B3A94B5|nr:YibE/F family protein [Lachnoclostridium sp. An169]OUP82975.1 YibE/F family protein [Lachnoclostridium sp. An169]HJA65571.1 YibE/F family protein [Candidatus Mediterraneibacter cottocaccae]
MEALKRNRRRLVILLVTVLFALFLYRFNQIERVGLYDTEGKTFEKAEVVGILQDNETESGNQIGNQIVSLELLSGEFKGNTVEAVSSSSYLYGAHCEVGMRVIAEVNESDDSLYVTVFSYDRTWMLYAIVLLFLVTLCIIGGRQGLNSAIALVFTFVCIVFLFLPMIYRGISPIAAAVTVAVLTTFVTMYLIGGLSSKSVTSMVGTIAGVGISAVLAVLFGKLTNISGYNVSDIEQLEYVGQMTNVRIGELLYAGILISALGAVMDVAMSVASTISEIHYRNPELSRRELFASGISVGKDMMGTMSNTLILAFTGSSINTLVFMYVYSYTATQIINMYSIGIEIIQGISSTMGVILTVPIVSAVCTWHLKRKKHSPEPGE